MTLDQERLDAFVGRFVEDLGATIAAGGVVVGHRLGLYSALAEGPARRDELAARTATSPRCVTEWLRAQAAGGYVEYDPDSGAFALSEEQAFASPTRRARSTCPVRSCWRSGRCARSPRSPTRSAPTGMGCTSTMTTCRSARRCSSGPATWRTWCRAGSRASTVSWRSSRPGRGWPTSAAGSGLSAICRAAPPFRDLHVRRVRPY